MAANIKSFSDGIKFFVESVEIKDNWKKLCLVLTSPELVGVLAKSYGAVSVHHNRVGGLLEHTQEMLEMYYNLTASPQVQELNHGLVVAAIFFHDWGKSKTYKDDGHGIVYNENHSLMEHTFMSANFCLTFLKSLESKDIVFSQNEKSLLVHAILAHNGQKDWGSPVVPATKEAIVVHYLDQLSAKLSMMDASSHMKYNKHLRTSPIINENFK